jgi:hypothetical protein
VVSACMSGTSVKGGDVFRVIQLAGPTAREAEEQVAKYIEEQVALYDQRDPGAPTRRDGNGGLRIDFTYDAACPRSPWRSRPWSNLISGRLVLNCSSLRPNCRRLSAPKTWERGW